MLKKSPPSMDDELFSEIYQVLKSHADENKIPVFMKEDWKYIVDNFDRKEVIEVLAQYIIKEKPTFPERPIEYKNMEKCFSRLLERDILGLKVVHPSDDSNYDIKLKYDYDATQNNCLYMIQLGHEYNDTSSYFQQDNRLRCNSYGYKGPLNAWEDLAVLKKMNWTFWRPSMIGKNGLMARDYRSSMRVSGYVATQFKPHVAKCVYLMTGAKNILDTSCGWGDRLAAFYCTKIAEKYYGCDPNPNVYESYKKQCIEYEKLLGTKLEDIHISNKKEGNTSYFECKGQKHVKIYNGCAEDIVLGNRNFDILFTSPPYFQTEKYNEGGDGEEMQSWKKYQDFESWRDDFLFRMIDNVAVSLKKGGKIMLNIVDPQIKKTRYEVCDDMVKKIEDLGFTYDGWILQRMKGAPTPSKKGELCGENWFGEPIFSFTK